MIFHGKSMLLFHGPLMQPASWDESPGVDGMMERKTEDFWG